MMHWWLLYTIKSEVRHDSFGITPIFPEQRMYVHVGIYIQLQSRFSSNDCVTSTCSEIAKARFRLLGRTVRIYAQSHSAENTYLIPRTTTTA